MPFLSQVFEPGFGLSFENAARDKKTRISAAFDPTSVNSPAGDRIVTVPDIPSGGTLHVVTKGAAQVSNVGHVVMDTTAGIIESNQDVLLPADAEEYIYLTNRLIQTDTVIICTIADPGSGGQLTIRAAKVETSTDRHASIVVHNRANVAMTSTFKVAFSIFN